ncbi:DUF6950 family protein [Defluviimonas salinarum]|uniref:DUF6950 domain-containing protein n=1 Tax=Defluviimonas salinarum TaxID=2992147 RepID=A0ABT3J402_9RHOB|nr:hypothetical protein [Defluviimonas salinarum]MCW3782124.1 hypothetical protein [Defluviimonas salinarum]
MKETRLPDSQIIGEARIRMPAWELALTQAIESARSSPFAWGVHDCASWVFDLRRDLTGGEDVAALWRGRYQTQRGAALVMRRLGWASLEDGARTLLGAPLGTVHLAQRGDLVLSSDGAALGICLGARAAFLGPEGLTFVPVSTCSLAWRV